MLAEETRKIFLCYRRDDSGDATGRLRDRLALEFGDKSIFMDVDGTRLGTNFVGVDQPSDGTNVTLHILSIVKSPIKNPGKLARILRLSCAVQVPNDLDQRG